MLQAFFFFLCFCASVAASFPSDFGPQNCTDPNEEFHACIGICPGSVNWRDLTCADLVKQKSDEKMLKSGGSNTSSRQQLELPTGPKHPLCWSLRCFPGCRCRTGFARQQEQKGQCVEEKLCKA